ncbi:lipoate-protein ligase-like [Tropilaelaps mercedesae]|uniref:Lipoate-protein ligase-like n=1 Tax=Tropilaelaps mercedesae TaxID=418985 RepID=A0A1V9X131_9ACAR|nr:lipoate-protein ligase-like [Tropilaelaps mercedesae]
MSGFPWLGVILCICSSVSVAWADDTLAAEADHTIEAPSASHPIVSRRCRETSTMVFLTRLSRCPTAAVAAVRPGSVLISRSPCIYSNLALETWLFERLEFADVERGMLFMWTNRPCVVIGRHQNPWFEANLKRMSELNVAIARRNSGGGTVYHDQGNLNVSFLGPKATYNRKRNLHMICTVLKRHYGISAEPNERDDIIVDGKYKVSGTASKLAHRKAYHHCTLLVNVDKAVLGEVLQNSCEHQVETKSTRSVRAETINLTDVAPQVEMCALARRLGEQFASEVQTGAGLREVDVTEEAFPGVTNMTRQLQDWEWQFGWTPRFKISTDKLVVCVYHGRIENITEVGARFEASALGLANIVLRGKKFTIEEITAVLGRLDSQRDRLSPLQDALIECVNVVSYT